MPVSYWPCIFPLLLVIWPLFLISKGRRAIARAYAISAAIICLLLLVVFVPGWYWRIGASRRDPYAMYQYARWSVNHSNQLNVVILWPFDPDIDGGHYWLEESAAKDYPPALFAWGVELKYGHGVPMPPDWRGPGGNVFPQPERGQPFIDRALAKGYKPPVSEESFYYWTDYSK